MSNRREYASPVILLDKLELDKIQKIYKPEDFSQQAINQGQRYINGELTELVKTLANTLKALKDAIKGSSGGSQINFGTIETDITQAIDRSEKVAGYYPPGCFYSPPGGNGGGGSEGTGEPPQG